jgi:hypothetical protein
MGDPGPFQNSVLYQYLWENIPREWFICEMCCANVVFTMVAALSFVSSGGVGALRNAPKAGRTKEKKEIEETTEDLMVTEMTQKSPID